MKILKNIVLGIGVLVVLLCAFILMCAVNPNITESLSSMIARDGRSRKETVREEEVEEPSQDEYKWEEDEEEIPQTKEKSDDTPEVINDTEDNEGRTQQQTEDETTPRGASGAKHESSVRGTNGYEPPAELDIKVPEAVSGKSGYQPRSRSQIPNKNATTRLLSELDSSAGWEENRKINTISKIAGK